MSPPVLQKPPVPRPPAAGAGARRRAPEPSRSAATCPSTGSATARCASSGAASGATRRTGPRAIAVLRRAVELGVDLIDTADSYGPFVSEDLIREALHPYADGVVDRDQGRLHPAGPERVEGRRPARVPAAVRGDVAAPPRRGAHRPVPAAPDRSGGPAGRPARRARRAAPAGQDPPHRAVRGQRGAAGGGPRARADRHGAEPLQPDRPRLARPCWTCASARASASSRGSPSPPGRWPGRTVRWRRWPSGRAPPRRSWRWPGCCGAPPVMLPIPGTVVGRAPGGELRGGRSCAWTTRPTPSCRPWPVATGCG